MPMNFKRGREDKSIKMLFWSDDMKRPKTIAEQEIRKARVQLVKQIIALFVGVLCFTFLIGYGY